MKMKASDAKKVLERQYRRQNDFIKENYDRISVTLPKGFKDRIRATGASINEFVNAAVLAELERRENTESIDF